MADSTQDAQHSGDPADVENDIVEALRSVYDPEIPVNIYELGLIYTVGDAVRRYLIPIEWLLFLFAVLGAEWLIDIAARLFRRRGDMPAMTPVPAQ